MIEFFWKCKEWNLNKSWFILIIMYFGKWCMFFMFVNGVNLFVCSVGLDKIN